MNASMASAPVRDAYMAKLDQTSCRSYGLSLWVAGPIDVQRRIARQRGERLARRARSHGGFLDIDQSLDAGFKPCFTKITP
jgi:hypothetical protein